MIRAQAAEAVVVGHLSDYPSVQWMRRVRAQDSGGDLQRADGFTGPTFESEARRKEDDSVLSLVQSRTASFSDSKPNSMASRVAQRRLNKLDRVKRIAKRALASNIEPDKPSNTDQ